MRKAKSRLSHNKGKKLYTYIEFGLIPRKKRSYRNPKSGLTGFTALGISLLITAAFCVLPVLAKEPEFISPIPQEEEITEDNLAREVQQEEQQLAQSVLNAEPFPQEDSQDSYLEDEDYKTFMKFSEWVVKYTVQLIPTRGRQSETIGIMQCLLNRESQHTEMDENTHHGDNGMAGGSLQYWEETWVGYRKLMIKEGLITEIGSRYDAEQAVFTTVWAINSGRAKAWGPIFRDMNGTPGRNCSTPSWY